jgi:hypothetical protein
VSKNQQSIYRLSFDLTTNQITRNILYSSKKDKGKRKFSWLEDLFGVDKHSESFRVSPNREYFAFVSDMIDYKTEGYGVRVFDKNFNLVYTKSYKGDFEKHYYLRNYLITDNAEVIFVGKLYEKGKKEKKKGKANYDYVVHKLTKDGATIKVLDLGEDYYINDVGLIINDGVVKFFGLYSELASKYVKGTVSYVFNGTDISSMDVNLSPFSKDAFNDIYNSNRAKRLSEEEVELEFYRFNHIVSDEVGNAYLTAEQVYYVKRGKYYEVRYGNIMVVKLDTEGKQLWSRNIYKKEKFSDYKPVISNNRLHIFLNAGKRLLERSNNRVKVRTGAFERTALFDIPFDPENGDYVFESLRENSITSRYPARWGKWNGERFLVGFFGKPRGEFSL